MEIHKERELNKILPPEIRNSALMNILNLQKPKCATFAHKDTTSSIFEVTFIEGKSEYSYGFEVGRNRIINEWFQVDNRYLFERKQKNDSGIKEYTYITNMVPDDQLYLSHLIPYAKIEKDESMYYLKKFFISIVIFMDFEKLDPNVLNAFLVNIFNDKRMSVTIEKLNEYFNIIDFGIIRMDYDKTRNAIYFIHKGKNDTFKIYLPDESLGTKKMLFVLLNILEKMENGGLIVSDELTSSLHPLLSKLILDSISDSEINKGNAQIIFTTHDLYLMRKEQFRRDEIGFVTKDECGESHFSKLYDYKDEDNVRVRNDASYWKNYIRGTYEGTPHINYDLFLNEEGVLYGKTQQKKKSKKTNKG